MERAVERDPLNAFWRGVLTSHLVHARRFDEAIRRANEALEVDQANIVPHVTLGEAYDGPHTEGVDPCKRARALHADCRNGSMTSMNANRWKSVSCV